MCFLLFFRPLYLRLEFDSHADGWTAFQLLQKASQSGAPIYPTWVPSSTYNLLLSKVNHKKLHIIVAPEESHAEDLAAVLEETEELSAVPPVPLEQPQEDEGLLFTEENPPVVAEETSPGEHTEAQKPGADSSHRHYSSSEESYEEEEDFLGDGDEEEDEDANHAFIPAM